jgi:6-pyruvoyltetrahydropterin/6-carboxytetrahydropterin synthase
MYEVGVVVQFEAAHRLRGNFGPATRTHGHTYRVEIALTGATLRNDDALLDIGDLQAIVDELVEALHFRDLDELPAFRDRNTTAEAVARYFYDRVASRMAGSGAVGLKATVWESPKAWASYEGPVD